MKNKSVPAAMAAIALWGCGPNDETEEPTEFSTSCVGFEPDPADATFVVGHLVGGSRTFYPLVSGDTLDMDYGDQGGQHVFLAARLLGEGRDYTLRFTYTVDGQTHGSLAQRVESCDPEWTAVDRVTLVLNSGASVSGMLNVTVEGEGAPPPVDIPMSVAGEQ